MQSFLSHGMLQSFFAKLFIPWEKKLCQKALQTCVASIWRKNWCCKGNFFLIVYLVNHIEIKVAIIEIYWIIAIILPAIMKKYCKCNISLKKVFLYGLLNKLFKRNFLCNINFFRQIDFLQSFFSHGTKSFAKNLCNIPWGKNLCTF